MNEKQYFKKILDDDMPDLEKVRRACINQPIAKHAAFPIWAKRVVPSVLCLAIVAVSVVVGSGVGRSEKGIVLKGEPYTSVTTGKNGEIASTAKSTDKSSNDGGYTQNTENKSDEPNETTTAEQTSVQGLSGDKQLGQNTDNNILSIKFSSLDEMIENAKSYKTISDLNASAESGEKFSESKVTMILQGRYVLKPSFGSGYSFINGSLEASGEYQFTALCNRYKSTVKFSYTTYKESSFEQSSNQTFVSDNGIKVHYGSDIAYWFYDGYRCSLRMSGDETDFKQFVDSLVLEKCNLD